MIMMYGFHEISLQSKNTCYFVYSMLKSHKHYVKQKEPEKSIAEQMLLEVETPTAFTKNDRHGRVWDRNVVEGDQGRLPGVLDKFEILALCLHKCEDSPSCLLEDRFQ